MVKSKGNQSPNMHLTQSFIFRHLRQAPFRALSTLLGIAAGIAVIIAIQLAKTSSVAGFREAIEQMSGKAALEISASGGLPEDRLRELIPLETYGLLCPVVEGEVTIAEETVHVLGVDILLDQAVRDYDLVDFGNGRGQPTPTEFLNLLKNPNSIILTQKLAKRHGWQVGSTVQMASGDEFIPMQISALLLDKGAARAMGGNFALMDIAAAQWRLGKLGKLDRLEIKLREGLDVEEAEREIASQLKPGLTLSRPERRGSEVEKMLTAYHFNLTLLSGIALLAGLYVIYNSVSLSVIGRRVEIGMLRTLGVTRGQVTRLFLAEAALLAIPGCLLGLLFGQWLGHGTLKLTQLTAATLYTQSNVLLAPLSLELAVPVVILGVVLALIAAWQPAREASRLAPITAVRNIPEVAISSRGNWRALAWCFGLLLLGWATCYFPMVQGVPVFGAVACLLAVAAVIVLTPSLLRWFLGGLRGVIVRRAGVTGQLAWGNLQAGQRRLAIPVSALGGTLALTTAIAIMVGSFRETLTYWVDNSLAADLYIRPATKRGAGGSIGFSPETAALLTQHPDILAADALRNFDIPYQNSRIVLNAANFTVAARHGRLLFKGIWDWRSVLAECQQTHGVVISEPMALRYKLGVGDTVSLPTLSGEHAFPIKAVYFDYSNDRGSVTMDHTTYEKYFGPLVPTNMAIFLKPGANADGVREALLEKLGATKNVQIFTNASLRVEVMRIFDRSFSITWALEIVAILVAMAGVATTVLTLVLERREEMNLLRQLGTTQAQLRKTMAIEAGVIGLMSQIIGVGLGLLLSLVLIYVINVQSFGWTIQFHFPALLLGQFSLALPLATAAAGWLFAKWILQRSQRSALPVDLSE